MQQEKINSVLFVGPISPPVTGQSVAFTKAFECIDTKGKYLVNNNLTGKNPIVKVFLTLYTVVKTSWVLVTKRVDIVYFTCSRSFLGSVKDVVLILVARAVGARIVNHLHGADFKSFYESLPKWYKNIIHKTYSHIDTTIVLIEKMKEQFSMFPKMHLVVIHNFYDKTLECNAVDLQQKKSTSNENNPTQLLYISNIMATKGIFNLLDAFKKIQKKYNVLLKIAGDFVGDCDISGKEVEKKFREKLKNTTNIEYLGLVHSEVKRQLLCSSDIFILPSYYISEAVPISILEAMATHNALIITNHNYLSSFENGVNKVIPVRDIHTIAHAIEYFIKNPDKLKEAKETNLQYARTNFSDKVYNNDIKKVFQYNYINKI